MHIAENHIDLRALRQVLRERFRALAEQGGVYPLRRLLAVFLLAVVVCQREIGDSVAACRVFQFCIAAQPHESGEDFHYAASFRLLSRRSEEQTSELQSLMRISYSVFCLKKNRTSHMRQSRHNSI